MDLYELLFPNGIAIFNGVLLTKEDISREFIMSPSSGTEILIPVFAPGENFNPDNFEAGITDFRPLVADMNSSDGNSLVQTSLISYQAGGEEDISMNAYLTELINEQFEFKGYVPAESLNFSQETIESMNEYEGEEGGSGLTASMLEPIGVESDEESHVTGLVLFGNSALGSSIGSNSGQAATTNNTGEIRGNKDSDNTNTWYGINNNIGTVPQGMLVAVRWKNSNEVSSGRITAGQLTAGSGIITSGNEGVTTGNGGTSFGGRIDIGNGEAISGGQLTAGNGGSLTAGNVLTVGTLTVGDLGVFSDNVFVRSEGARSNGLTVVDNGGHRSGEQLIVGGEGARSGGLLVVDDGGLRSSGQIIVGNLGVISGGQPAPTDGNSGAKFEVRNSDSSAGSGSYEGKFPKANIYEIIGGGTSNGIQVILRQDIGQGTLNGAGLVAEDPVLDGRYAKDENNFRVSIPNFGTGGSAESGGSNIFDKLRNDLAVDVTDFLKKLYVYPISELGYESLAGAN